MNEQQFIWSAQEGSLEACAQAMAAGLVDVDVQDQVTTTTRDRAIRRWDFACLAFACLLACLHSK